MEIALESDAFGTGAEDDASLAEAAKTDADAFGMLYERFYPRVYRYCYHRVGNAADAEDITALVFMKTLEALHTFRPGRGGFAPWLFRITRNAVIDFYRRGKRQQPLEDFDCEAPGVDPALDALRSEQREELHALLSLLSPDQRDVVLMRYAADLSFAEIAAALGKNEAAVRMLLHRGLRKLKAVLNA